MDDPDHIRLTLRALPDPVPADVRLRRALKALLRVYGFRCVKVEGAAGEAAPPPALPDTEGRQP